MEYFEFIQAGGRFEDNKLFVKEIHAGSITVIENKLTLRVHNGRTQQIRECIDFVGRSFMIDVSKKD